MGSILGLVYMQYIVLLEDVWFSLLLKAEWSSDLSNIKGSGLTIPCHSNISKNVE